jgi:aminopeptidase N
MEHAGAILYNASGLMLDDSATQNQRLNRANVISHETSHMWFGDLVTMKWFDDVWMKEVFANFMAAKIVNPSFPDVNHELRFLLQNYPVAYDVDRTDGANPIRQSLANLNEAGSLYGAIIYQKAPIVMRQLEFLVGADAFRDGVRTYLRRYAFGNATWPDLISELDARKPRNLPAWSHAWVDEPGRPTVKTELQASDGKIRRLVFHQEDPRNRALAWPQRIQVLLGYPTKVEAIDVSLEEAATAVPEAAGRDTPIWILPVGRGLGYGLFDLDPATLEYFTSSLAKIADPLTRGSALVTVWEAMLEGQVPPARVRDMLLSSLPRETNELNVQQMLTYLRQSFWRFTPIGTRPSVAGQVEHVIKDGLDAATSQSLKAAWFGALRNVALTPMTVNWLERVWKHDVTIPGLTFSESDDADLALDLAVRDVPDTPMILRTQLERFRNPDRKARFAFVIPAVSGDATTRLRFFDSLKDARNRQHEAWVLDAATYLHHPLRARESQALVRPALDLVLEIQRTGDIFFPKRWADATLGGYQTHQVATDVRAFLDGLPADYPPRLRWVVLSAADMLFRASRLAAPKNE